MSLAHVDHQPPTLPGQLTESALATLKATIAHDLTDPELELFAAVCERTGLDPFVKQIYAIKRTSRRKVRGNWIEEDTLTFQTAIDGYRTIAKRSGQYGGQDAAEWCGSDGAWTDVWLSSEPPVAARVAVWRKDVPRPFVGVARFDAYADRWPAKDGQDKGDLRNLWKTMPDNQIAKCAEALALRKAFPNDLSGIYVTEEMDQAAVPIDVHAHDQAGIPARDFDELVAASEQLTGAQLDEVKAWCAAEGIALKRAELTSENAHRVMTRILEVGRSGGGGATSEGSAASPPPPPSSDDGAVPPAPVVDDSQSGGDGPPPSSPAAPVEPGSGGSEDSTTASEHPATAEPPSAASGPVPVDTLLAATRAATPAARTIRVMQATRHAAATLGVDCPPTPEAVADDQALAAKVLQALEAEHGPAPVVSDEHVAWKVHDQPSWDRWRKRCNAKAGPGTKDKPHPRLLDDGDDYDLQRHALAWMASRKFRGDDLAVTSWDDVTKAEAEAIEAALGAIKDGEAAWVFTSEPWPDAVMAATGGWILERAKGAAA